MKQTKQSRVSYLVIAIACALLATHAAQASTYVWTNTIAGTFNWSSATNWDAAGVPPSDGTADVVFSNNTSATAYAYTVTVDTNWSATGAVRSLTFLSGGNNGSSDTLSPGAGVTNLSIGVGGLKLDPTQTWATRVCNINLILAASQAWFIEMGSNFGDNRYFQILKDLTSPPGVNWILGGRSRTQFDSGSSTGFLGQVTLNGSVVLSVTNQYGRLGANPITVDNNNNLVAASSVGYPQLVFNDLNAGAGTMPNAFVLNLTNSTQYNFFMMLGRAPSAIVGTGASIDFTNSWSGAITAGMFQVASTYPVWDDRYMFKFSGNNAALQGPTNTVGNNSAMFINRCHVVLNGPHALGTNNSLSITIGTYNSAIIGAPSGLLATHGNTVNAGIVLPLANAGMPANNNAQTPVVLGLYGTGTVTFAGSIYATGPQNNGTAGCMAHMPRLTAPSNGTARFTGNFTDDGTNGAPMQILGLGDVALYGTNTGFLAQTLIRSGRLLLGSPFAVSTNAPINLGDVVTVPTGGPVRLATVLPAGGTWATGTYTFSSAPTIDGVVPAVGDRVLVKDEQSTAAQNGIYTVNAAKSWSRAADLDETNEFVYGLRVLITNGTVNAGRAVYLFNRNEFSVNAFVVNTHKVAFNFEPSPNPDVALLTAAAITVTNAVLVANNYSTGTSTIGGATADASTFKGAITLNRAVQMTAASGGTVTFSGAIGGTGSVTKVGAGVLKLTSLSNSYSGGTSIRVSADELATGAMLISSNLNLSGGADALTVTGTLDRNTTYTIASFGTLNGQFDTVTGAPKHNLFYNGPGNTIQLKPLPKGTVMTIR